MTTLPPYPSLPGLQQSFRALEHSPMSDLFEKEPDRCRQMSLQAAGLTLDYSRHRITASVLEQLVQLSEDAHLGPCRQALLQGDPINQSEDRAVLHTALRHPGDPDIQVAGQAVMPAIRQCLSTMEKLCDQIHSGQWVGWTGKPIKHLINIGIGGSFLGIRTVLEALAPWQRPGLQAHYIVNVDPTDLANTLAAIDPECSLFIICSKSFATLETRLNAEAVRDWMRQQGMPEEARKRHFVAISSNREQAVRFGVDADNVLPLWDWVGGRYSLWSAIGLLIPLMTGMDVFRRLQAGAFAMDEHFRTAEPAANMPVIMAVLGIWYSNFFGAQSQAVLPYASQLSSFPSHLQQLDMESNGKRTTNTGHAVEWETGPVIWGGVGTNGQHAYHQLLHQGTRLIPVDIIATLDNTSGPGLHRDWLFAHALAQAQALAFGCPESEVRARMAAQGYEQGVIDCLAPQKAIPGNRPVSLLVMDKLEPETLGALIALYEHKVFVQGVIWQINSFDQFGVELGKVLGDSIFEHLTGTQTPPEPDLPPGLSPWIERYRAFHKRCV
ncbi:MAG: glucose-6-phosphate isomerase [Kistimonas sp.]|nr:glucose-6-phosphate isomerase [Kistimonas sp.]